jgi:hypothetical protein
LQSFFRGNSDAGGLAILSELVIRRDWRALAGEAALCCMSQLTAELTSRVQVPYVPRTVLVKAEANSESRLNSRCTRVHLTAVALAAIVVATASNQAEAAWGEATGDPGHFGFVLDGAAEFGGDNLVEVIYRNGDTQNIKAGQGVTLGGGIHYRPVALPVDFAATVGYKFVRTASNNTDLGVDRVVLEFTGTVPVGHDFWVTAGPVWHTAVKLNGDGLVPNVDFDDAVGGMVGFGWRWVGVRYTNIKYRARDPFTGSVDASSGGISVAWKF